MAVGTLVTLGSATEDRIRLGQTLGRDSVGGFLLRTPSVLSRPTAGSRPGTFVLLPPDVLLVHNSALPTPDNYGALWAGRGTNVRVRAGVAVTVGRVSAVLAPELRYSQNLGFQSTPAGLEGQQPPTGPFNAPWFTGPYSIDLPIRFGDQSYTTFGLGQSTVGVAAGPVVAGLSTENQWWGPGVRNALLLGNAAEGVPHAFVRTAHPIPTGVGEVEARLILGGLTASPFSRDTTPGAGRRALSGGVMTLRLRAEPGLTIGVARLVLTPLPSGSRIAGHAFDVLTRNQNLGLGDTLTSRRIDQLASLFARWVFPGTGTEVYGEFARSELPRSLRDLLIAPMNTGAYTIGVASALRPRRDGVFRVNLELTDLEQNRTFTDRPQPPDYYTGRAAAAGFTNRGQVLGASIGPGSQSQWASVDYYASGWQAGVFAQRTRNQNDAFYRVFLPNFCRHDVTLAGGVRGGASIRGLDARATLTASDRLNYLFQNGCANYLSLGTVDAHNLSLAITLAPRRRSAR